MKAIHKYPLQPVFGMQHVEMPIGAKLLSVHTQHDDVCVWAMVDPDVSLTTYPIVVLPTGGRMEREPGRFLGTVLRLGGAIVLHVFEAP